MHVDVEWVHCRAKPGVLSLPGLLPPPAPAGATGWRRRRRRGRRRGGGWGESVHYLPRRWKEGAPRVSGFLTKTPATPAAHNQFRTSWLERGLKVRCEGRKRKRRKNEEEVRVISCVRRRRV